jgi:hypothetical protein
LRSGNFVTVIISQRQIVHGLLRRPSMCISDIFHCSMLISSQCELQKALHPVTRTPYTHPLRIDPYTHPLRITPYTHSQAQALAKDLTHSHKRLLDFSRAYSPTNATVTVATFAVAVAMILVAMILV